MDTKNNEDAMIQDLWDAGCDSEKIAILIEHFRQRRIDAGLRLLAAHRRILLA